MSQSGAVPGLGEERLVPGEDVMIDRILADSLALLETKAKVVPRGQHAKHLGCVLAEFRVEPELPDELRVGVFREGCVFPALIRFSNGRGSDERKGDIHGMAIKLLEVPGEKVLGSEKNARTQDFILADSPEFFIPNLVEYVPFSNDVARAKNSRFHALVFLLKMVLFHRRMFRELRKALSRKPDSPLRIPYWSQTPYRLGRHAVKYDVQPDLSLVPPPAPSDSPSKLRDALAAHLANHEARFDFRVQVQTDPVAMPVEDPTVPWDEKLSCFRKVATIRIAAQTFETPEKIAFYENLSFTPWHALPEHRPLGGINRARRRIYDALSRRRHELNNVIRFEPSLTDVPGASVFGSVVQGG